MTSVIMTFRQLPLFLYFETAIWEYWTLWNGTLISFYLFSLILYLL